MRKTRPLQVTVQDDPFVDGSGPFVDGGHATSGPECRGSVTVVAIGAGAPARRPPTGWTGA
ncbi:hypothetical protein [Streptomyces sp. NPDC054804]